MKKVMVVIGLLMSVSAHAEYDAYKLKEAYKICGSGPLTMGRYELVREDILKGQERLMQAMAGGENIENPPTREEINKCSGALLTFLEDLKHRSAGVKNAKTQD